eukprot:4131948-Pyramimonas_sp.AAC.1
MPNPALERTAARLRPNVQNRAPIGIPDAPAPVEGSLRFTIPEVLVPRIPDRIQGPIAGSGAPAPARAALA